MIYNFIIFLCNNIFIVKWQGGTQADIVQVLPKKNYNDNDENNNNNNFFFFYNNKTKLYS